MANLQELITPLVERITSGAVLLQLSLNLLKALLVLAAGKLTLKLLYFLVNKFFEERTSKDLHTKQRNKTLHSVAKSALRYLVYFIVITIVLDLFGIPTASILAGAGIVGLALGFGAQSLVKDIITGFFILFEDQFTVGDYIKTSDVEGIVEEVNLRITKIKNFDGDLHIIPNSNIDQVTNLTAAKKRALVDVPIDYGQNIEEATAVLEDLCSKLGEEFSDILQKGPQVLGVEKLADSSVNIRITAMVDPLEVWRMNRIIRQRVKERLDAEGISIPFNHLTIVKQQEKEEN